MKYNRVGTDNAKRIANCKHEYKAGKMEIVWYAPWLERFHWQCNMCGLEGYTKESFHTEMEFI